MWMFCTIFVEKLDDFLILQKRQIVDFLIQYSILENGTPVVVVIGRIVQCERAVEVFIIQQVR
jgi:hypothetical protein